MDKYIQIFIDFIPNDKRFIDTLMPKYEKEFRVIGMFIEKHDGTTLNCRDNEFMEELLDFLDGNGFEVIRPEIKNPYNSHPIKLIPIYERTITQAIETTTKEIEEENETLEEAIKKIQSALNKYVPLQTCTLSYTSMEVDEGPILEREELYTPRPLRICLRRCLELLRLLSESRRRSAPLPRPP